MALADCHAPMAFKANGPFFNTFLMLRLAERITKHNQRFLFTLPLTVGHGKPPYWARIGTAPLIRRLRFLRLQNTPSHCEEKLSIFFG